MHTAIVKRAARLLTSRRFASANLNLLGVTLSSGILLPFIQGILQRFQGFSSLELSLVAILTVVSSKGSQVLFGSFVDGAEKRRVLIASGLGYGVSLVGWSLVGGFLPSLIFTAVIGGLSALNILAAKAIIAQVGSETNETTLGFSILNMVVNLTSAVGASLGASIWLLGNGKVLFAVAAACSIVSSLLLGLLSWRSEADEERKGGRSAGTLRTVLRDRRFLSTLPFFAVGFFLYAQFFTTLPFYLCVQSESRHAGAIGAIFALNSAMIVFLQVPMAHAVDALARRGRRASTVFVFSFFVLSFVVISVSSSFAALMLVTVLFTIGEMLFTPFVDALTAGFSSREDRATYFGVATGARALGDAAGGGLGIYLVSELGRSGRGQQFWVVIAGIAVVLVVGLIGLVKRESSSPAFG